jgi:uncharacterized protein (DUF305 family)
MALSSRFLIAPLFLARAIAAPAQQSAPIVQPGAPGQPGKLLTEATVRPPFKPPFGADVEFMQGMIMHHQQAVDMVALLRTRVKSPVLRSFGEKIAISQSDEIRFMKQWLESRGKPTTMEMNMSAADMKNMLMPGMLTPEQMAALTKARGAQFDHLFLTGMIQHHGGALTMVDELFKTPGAGQDPVLFDFATDIDATQSAEIKIMQGMLDQEKK